MGNEDANTVVIWKIKNLALYINLLKKKDSPAWKLATTHHSNLTQTEQDNQM